MPHKNSTGGREGSGSVTPQEILYHWLLRYQDVLNVDGSEIYDRLTPGGFDAWITHNLSLMCDDSDMGYPVPYHKIKDSFLCTHPDSMVAITIRSFLDEIADTRDGRVVFADLYRRDRRVHQIMGLGLLGKSKDSRVKSRAIFVIALTGRNIENAFMVPLVDLRTSGEESIVDAPVTNGMSVAVAILYQIFEPYTGTARQTWGSSAMPKEDHGGKRRGWMNYESEFDPEYKQKFDASELEGSDEWVRVSTGKKGGSASKPTAVAGCALDSFCHSLTATKPSSTQPRVVGKPGSKRSASVAQLNPAESGMISGLGAKPISVISGGVLVPIVGSGTRGLAPTSTVSTSEVASAPASGVNNGGTNTRLVTNLPAPGAVAATTAPLGSDSRGISSANPAVASHDDRVHRAVAALLASEDGRIPEIVGGMMPDIAPGAPGSTDVEVLIRTALYAIGTLRTKPDGWQRFLTLAGLVDAPRPPPRSRAAIAAAERDAYRFSAEGSFIRQTLDEMLREREYPNMTLNEMIRARECTRPNDKVKSGGNPEAVPPTIVGFDLDDFLAKTAVLVEKCNHGELYRKMFRDICQTLSEPLLILLFMQCVTDFSECIPVNFGYRAAKALQLVTIDFYTFLRLPTTYLQSGIYYDLVSKEYTPMEETPLFKQHAPVVLRQFYLTSVKAFQDAGMPDCCARYLGRLEAMKHRGYSRFRELYDKDPRVVEWAKRDTHDKHTPREIVRWHYDKSMPAILVKSETP